MRIKFDENLPAEAALTLRARRHDVHTVDEERLLGRPDIEIWQAAQREQRFLITQDLDFSDARRFVPGEHHGILLLRLRSPSRSLLSRRIEELFAVEDAESWSGCFVVATERKTRVRRPSQSG